MTRGSRSDPARQLPAAAGEAGPSPRNGSGISPQHDATHPRGTHEPPLRRRGGNVTANEEMETCKPGGGFGRVGFAVRFLIVHHHNGWILLSTSLTPPTPSWSQANPPGERCSEHLHRWQSSSSPSPGCTITCCRGSSSTSDPQVADGPEHGQAASPRGAPALPKPEGNEGRELAVPEEDPASRQPSPGICSPGGSAGEDKGIAGPGSGGLSRLWGPLRRMERESRAAAITPTGRFGSKAPPVPEHPAHPGTLTPGWWALQGQPGSLLAAAPGVTMGNAGGPLCHPSVPKALKEGGWHRHKDQNPLLGDGGFRLPLTKARRPHRAPRVPSARSQPRLASSPAVTAAP